MFCPTCIIDVIITTGHYTSLRLKSHIISNQHVSVLVSTYIPHWTSRGFKSTGHCSDIHVMFTTGHYQAIRLSAWSHGILPACFRPAAIAIYTTGHCDQYA